MYYCIRSGWISGNENDIYKENVCAIILDFIVNGNVKITKIKKNYILLYVFYRINGYTNDIDKGNENDSNNTPGTDCY